MRKTFQLWLFFCVAAAFLVTFAVSFLSQTRQADRNAAELIELKLRDAKEQIQINDRNLATIREIIYSAAMAKCHTFSELIKRDPTILDDQARLEKFAKTLDVDELHVSDGDGVLIASVPKEYRGYSMKESDQSAEFLPAISNPDFELMQEPRRKGIDNKLFQYAGVARIDEPGIVQIGFFPSRLEKAMELADVKNLAAGFRIGTHGTILLSQNNVIVSDSDEWLGKSLADRGIDEKNVVGTSGRFRCIIADSPIFGESGDKRPMQLIERQTLCLYEHFDGYTLLGLLPENEMYISRDQTLLEIILFNVVLFAVVFGIVSVMVDRIVIRGIHRVNTSLAKITAGDLDEKANVRTNAEFASLSDGINTTVAALKDAIAESAARIDKELEFARTIQIGSLPSLFPPFPDRTEFDIFATMETAKEVGGDFYDFLLIDDNHLGVIIADVSGKGIPAALFMMTTKTVAKNYAQFGKSPALILTETNNRICEDNQSGMFVTAFIGILEISTGRFTCSSAGHNPPVLIHANGKSEYLQSDGGIVLGGMAGVEYGESSMTFQEGDRLYLYTDGVTEALNPDGDLYGEKNLLSLLTGEKIAQMPLEELLRAVRTSVKQFANGALQSDDITMMAVEFIGPVKDKSTRI